MTKDVAWTKKTALNYYNCYSNAMSSIAMTFAFKSASTEIPESQ